MCGICGAVGGLNITPTEVVLLQKLMILNGFRGMDSSGMFDLIRVKEGVLEKVVMKIKGKKVAQEEKPSPFAYWKTIFDAHKFATVQMPYVAATRWNKHTLKAIVCHARAATQGEITQENSHPFKYKNIIGVHNGTITGDFEDRKEVAVDSHALIMNIQKYGPKEAIERITDKATNVAYALVYMDIEKQILYAMRNTQRPLSWVVVNGTAYFSSERKDLGYVFNLPVSSYEIKDFKSETLYSIDLKHDGLGFTEQEFNIPRRILPPYRAPAGHWDSVNDCWVDDDIPFSLSQEDEDDPKMDNNNISYLPRRPKDVAPMDPDERIVWEYERNWKFKTWIRVEESGYHNKLTSVKYYDIAFGRYFTEYLFKIIQLWRQDHKEEYEWKFLKVWTDATDKQKEMLFDRCEIPPHNIQKVHGRFIYKTAAQPKFGKPDTQSAIIPEKKEADDGLKIPFGVSGRKCSELKYLEKLSKGCSYCEGDVDANTILYWLDEDSFLCDECQYEVMTDSTTNLHNIVDYRKVEAYLDNLTKHKEGESLQ